jgi:hypothetical protein
MRKTKKKKKKNDYQGLSHYTANKQGIVERFTFSREQLKKGGSPLSFTQVSRLV